MSILLAESMTRTVNGMATPSSTGAPTTAPVDHSQTILIIFLAWAAAGVVVAGLLGAFSRKSIVGPKRLLANESAWDLMLILFIGFFAGAFADLILIGLIHPSPGAKMLILGAAVDLATFATVVTILKNLRPGSLKRLGLDPKRMAAGFAGGAATLFVLFPLIQLTSEVVELIFDHFHFARAKPHELLQLLGDTKDRRLSIFAIFLAVIIAPLTEELLYRGLLQTSLSRLFNWAGGGEFASLAGMTFGASTNKSAPVLDDESGAKSLGPPGAAARWAAVIVSSMAFAAIHHEPAFLAPLFVLAVGLGYAYERTGNLWLTITAHALFNTAQIVLYLAIGH
jgi:membrane protease YdiL (CAAX protease family)